MGFIKSLFNKKALALETVKTQERLYFKAKKQYPDKEPHELLMGVYLGRRQVIGDDISSDEMQIVAETETELFACLYEPDNIRSLALYMLYKERHLNGNLLNQYPDYDKEYKKLTSAITDIQEKDPPRYERIYRLHNPRLANEIYGKDKSKDGKQFQLLLGQAKKVIKDTGKASTAILQRRLSLGYGTAAKLIEELEEQGLISQADGATPRKVNF
jgi:DNA segregation ATPase FtsK/SpoIIIE-like protein